MSGYDYLSHPISFTDAFYIIKTPQNESVIVYDLKQFCSDHKLNKALLKKVITGERRHYKQYYIKMFNVDKHFFQSEEYEDYERNNSFTSTLHDVIY